MDSDDEVIREVDVYFNEKFDVYLTQFPLRPVYSDPIHVKGAKFKPNNEILELTVPYPAEITKVLEKQGVTDTLQKYNSTEVLHSNNLAAAFIADNTMYIHPIRKVLQLHPNTKGNKNLNIELVEGLESDEDDDDYDSGRKQENIQQVQLKRKESERAQSARLQSYSYLIQNQEAEAWQPLKVHPIGKKPNIYDIL